MRKNADNLKISHRQLLSLALQGVPFALINVFHKKKTYHKHFHKLHWHEFIPIIKTKSLEFVTETKPLAINSDYWKFLASKILYFSPEKHSTQWLRPVLPMFSLRWFMLIIRKINQKLTWTWTVRKIFIPQDLISMKKHRTHQRGSFLCIYMKNNPNFPAVSVESCYSLLLISPKHSIFNLR